MNPLSVVAQLTRMPSRHFLGSCFAFRKPTHFLTAAHCVGTLDSSELAITLLAPAPTTCRAVALDTHPDADLAVVRIEVPDPHFITPFTRLPAGFALGEDFYAYGFSETILASDEKDQTSRAFKGYFQRFMLHSSYLGYRYTAAELSIPAPAGLSGVPVFSTEHLTSGYVYGVVPENVESSTLLDSVLEVQDGNRLVEERYKKVLNFGVALLLPDYEQWLEAVIGSG